MRCSTARNLMTKQLREALSGTEHEQLQQHLGGCDACRVESAQLQRFEEVLRAAGPAAVREAARVDAAAILARTPAGSPRAGWLTAVTAAAVLVTVAAAFLTLRPRPGGERAAVRRAEPPLAEKQPAPPPGIDLVPPRSIVALRKAPVAVPKQSRPPSHVPRRPPEPILAKRPPVSRAVRQSVTELTNVAHDPDPVELPAMRAQGAEMGMRSTVLAVAFAPAPPRAVPTSKVDPALEGDPRLQARVTLNEKDRPLAELLPELSKRLKVRLVAARGVADDKVTLLLKNRPAGEALTLLSRHLGFRWSRGESRYELLQDVASQRREQAMLRNELEPIETQLGLSARLLERPAAELRARVNELDELLKNEQLMPGERARLAAEKQTVLDAMLSPATVSAALGVFRSLTPAQIDSLLAGSEFRFSTANGTLPAAIAEKIHDSTSILEQLRGPQPRLQADANVRLTDVEDEDSVPPPRRNRQLRLFCTTTSLRGTPQDLHNWGSNWSPHVAEIPDAAPPSTNAVDADLQRVVDLELPGPARQPASITGGGFIDQARIGTVWPRQATLAEVAAAIQRATGLEVVADSFVSARIDPAILRGPHPLREVLSTLSRELDYTWEKRGKLLLLRNRRYYRDRPAEVSGRVLRPFRERVLAAGSLTLDELANLAAALTDPQARGMHRYWGWYLEETGILPPDWFFAHRQHLRLWASLTFLQKQTVRGGGELRTADMTAAQQQLWFAAFTSPPESARTPTSPQPLPPSELLATGSFSLDRKDVQSVIWVRTLPDGKRVGHGINVEGPPTIDVSKFGGAIDEMDVPQPQLSLVGYTFYYRLGSGSKSDRKVRILIGPLQPRPREKDPPK